MDRRQTDRVVAAIVGAVLLIGLVSTGQLLLSDDPVMGHAGSAPAIHFLGPLLLSVVVAAVVVAAYVTVSRDAFDIAASERTDPETSGSQTETSGSQAETSEIIEAGTSESDGREETSESDGREETSSAVSTDASGSTATLTRSERRVLDLLPEDERRVLEPVIESPGITQTAVADRADYSRSKVSQTVTDLEGRGLLYRERQGRTYRVYPADDLGDRR